MNAEPEDHVDLLRQILPFLMDETTVDIVVGFLAGDPTPQNHWRVYGVNLSAGPTSFYPISLK